MTGFRDADHPRISNGTFTEKQHSAPELTLDSMMPAERVEVTVPAYWIEKGVLPTPRHKVPRDVRRDINVTVTIPAIDSEDAPVCFTTTVRRMRVGGNEQVMQEYRVHAGEIYIPVTSWGSDDTVEATEHEIIRHVFQSPGERTWVNGSTAEAAAAEAQSHVEEYLSIDGELWSKTSEPVYYTRTYGLGGASGSTGLHIGNAREFLVEGHTAPENVFHAGQREEAIAYARALSEKRGDRINLGSIDNPDSIVVAEGFIPGSTFDAAPRLVYTDFYEAKYGKGYPADPAALERGLSELRAQLLTVPGAVVDVPDGWGGTTRRVDTSKLTSQQASDYNQYVEAVEELALQR